MWLINGQIILPCFTVFKQGNITVTVICKTKTSWTSAETLIFGITLKVKMIKTIFLKE
jgi:hypothetical protein